MGSRPEEAVTWFPTKVDWWLGVLLALGPAVAIGATIHQWRTAPGFEVWIGVAATAFLFAIYFLLVLPMRYGVGEEDLIVRHGVLRQRIPLATIERVERTRNPLSSPALSLDRLEVKFGEGFFKSALISPRDREGFMELLAARAGLERDGEKLVRPGQ